MSYEPTVWQTGDTVTAEKLNKLEQGVTNAGGGVFIIPITSTEDGHDITYSTTVTVGEIATALTNGKLCVCVDDLGSIFPFIEDVGDGSYNFQRLVKWPEVDTLGCQTFTISSDGVAFEYVAATIRFS